MEYKGHSYKYVKDDAFTPERFWMRIYITQKEYDGLMFRDQYNIGTEGYIEDLHGRRYFKEEFEPITESDKRYIDLILAGKL
jgi:hypothetical protein